MKCDLFKYLWYSLASLVAVSAVTLAACSPERDPAAVTVTTPAAVAPAPSPVVVKAAPVVVKAATQPAKPIGKKIAKSNAGLEKAAHAKAAKNAVRAECVLFAADVLGTFYVENGEVRDGKIVPDPRDEGVIGLNEADCEQALALKRALAKRGIVLK